MQDQNAPGHMLPGARCPGLSVPRQPSPPTHAVLSCHCCPDLGLGGLSYLLKMPPPDTMRTPTGPACANAASPGPRGQCARCRGNGMRGGTPPNAWRRARGGPLLRDTKDGRLPGIAPPTGGSAAAGSPAVAQGVCRARGAGCGAQGAGCGAGEAAHPWASPAVLRRTTPGRRSTPGGDRAPRDPGGPWGKQPGRRARTSRTEAARRGFLRGPRPPLRPRRPLRSIDNAVRVSCHNRPSVLRSPTSF